MLCVKPGLITKDRMRAKIVVAVHSHLHGLLALPLRVVSSDVDDFLNYQSVAALDLASLPGCIRAEALVAGASPATARCERSWLLGSYSHCL